MYQLFIIEGVGPDRKVRPVKPPSNDFDGLTLERDSMSQALLNAGIRLDQARAVVRPVFRQCEYGTCKRCDEARLDGSYLKPQYALLS